MNLSGRVPRLLAGVAWLALLGCGAAVESPRPPEPPFEPEPGFTPITLDDLGVFESEPSPEEPTWSEVGGRLECTGRPRGYVHSNETYRNFTLRFDLRYPDPEAAAEPGRPNTGVLLFIAGEHRVWPRCLEVQGRYDEIGHIKSNVRNLAVEVVDDPAARETARRPADEWNSIEVVVRDGTIHSSLNGTPIATSEPTELREGSFGLQSEGNPVHFRYVRLRRD